MQTETHPQGTPNWAELMTTDPGGALAFYSGLFGWADQAEPIPDSDEAYHMQIVGGDPVAAIGKINDDQLEQGVPSNWGVYLAADDVDAVAAKVEGAGGAVVLPPMDVMEHGRMAVITDPSGAVVSLWQARAHTGFGRMREHGTFTWAEEVTDNPDAAKAFFTQVLGVSAQTMPMPDGSEYTIIGPEGVEGAGIMKKRPEMGPMPNTWAIYFEVDDTDASAAKATELGGTVLQEPMDTPPAGRIAMIQDPQGAIFGIIKSMPMEEQ